MFKVFYLFILFSVLNACNSKNREEQIKSELSKSGNIQDAQLFSFSDHKEYTVLTVYSKKGDMKDEYFLIAGNKEVPKELINKNIIRTPVKNIVCLSTTHVAFVDALDQTDMITGVSGKKYIYNENLKRRIAKDEVRDVGYENSLDFESLLQLKPDVVTVYDINGTISPTINKIKKFNIPVVQINEYLESSALSQAEWIKFFGELFAERESAKAVYDSVKDEYIKLSSMTDTVEIRPSVLLNMPWKGTWYIPGGKSNIAKLISDAGGNYIWKESKEKHNKPLNIEEVYVKARNADIWLNPGQANTLNEVADTDDRLRSFKPYSTGRIYNRNKRVSISGGNDFMESGIIRPDLILKDLIKILHPELLPDHKLYYYRKLN